MGEGWIVQTWIILSDSTVSMTPLGTGPEVSTKSGEATHIRTHQQTPEHHVGDESEAIHTFLTVVPRITLLGTNAIKLTDDGRWVTAIEQTGILSEACSAAAITRSTTPQRSQQGPVPWHWNEWIHQTTDERIRATRTTRETWYPAHICRFPPPEKHQSESLKLCTKKKLLYNNFWKCFWTAYINKN